MRHVGYLGFGLLLVFAASADAVEVTLKPHTASFAPRFVSNDFARCEALKGAPEGVKAPEGEFTWGRLVLGEHDYLFACHTPKDRQAEGRIFVDRDGDEDLAEEKPGVGRWTSGHMPGMGFWGFYAKDLTARFEVRGVALETKVLARIRPPSTLEIFTTYCGTLPDLGVNVGVSWLPGCGAKLVDLGSGLSVQGCFKGPERLAVQPDSLEIRDGVPVIRAEFAKAEGLVAVPVGKDVAFWRAQQTWGPVPQTYCVPKGGKVHMPPGRWIGGLTLRREKAGVVWELTANRGEFTARAGADFGPVEPVYLKTRVRKVQSGTEFWPVLTDASAAAGVRIGKGGAVLKTFRLGVRDGDEKTVHSHEFQPDRDGHIRPHVWTIPVALAGKRLTATISPGFAGCPFKVVAEDTEFGGE
jgi:hypothetical protein